MEKSWLNSQGEYSIIVISVYVLQTNNNDL